MIKEKEGTGEGRKDTKFTSAKVGGYLQAWRQSQACQLSILQDFDTHLATQIRETIWDPERASP